MTCLIQTAGWLGRLGRAFQSAVFPHRCLGCGELYLPSEQKNAASAPPAAALTGSAFQNLVAPYLCGGCARSITLLKSPLCRVCGLPFESGVAEDHTCGDCLTSLNRFDLARSCGRYDQGLKHLIHGFKYKNIPQLASPLGVLLAWGFENYFSEHRFDLILPVPLHPRRMRQRGFNQAYLLAREAFAGKNGPIPSRPLPAVECGLLVRARATLPQTGLGRELRRKNLRNAFKVTRPEKVKKRSILLVDDVYTTGATVNECARTLKNAGARKVGVLSLARAV